MSPIPPGPPCPPGGDSLSSSMLLRLRAREPEAWRRLVDLYSPLVERWCRRWGLRDEEIPDLVQEVFLAASQSLDKFRRDRPGDTFRGWLYGVARNTRHNYRRRHGQHDPAPGGTDAHRHLLELPDPDADLLDGDDQLRSADREHLFRGALALIRREFEDKTWQMFWRVTVEERAPATIATDFGVSPATVRKAKSRVLRRLREEVGDLIQV